MLMKSSGVAFQQEKIQQMMLQRAWMLNGKVVVWFQGASFLSQEEKHWPNQDESVELGVDDPELKKETKSFAAAVVQQEDVLGYLDERISNWSKFKRIIALLLYY